MRLGHVAAALALFLLFGVSGTVLADDVAHFRKFKVPADEARILALTGGHEFRCDYEVTPSDTAMTNQGNPIRYQQDFELFAELYEGMDCVGRYRLANSVNAFNDLNLPLRGILAFGWNDEKHELISVIDNEQFYSPWTASLVLGNFSYVDHFFFENSMPETRHSNYGTSDFKIYPVVGICGDRTHKMNEMGFTDASSFLKVCKFAGAKNALVIYLYKSNGGDVPLKFDEPLSFNSVSSITHFWSTNHLCLASGVALIVFFILLFVTRSKRAARKAS